MLVSEGSQPILAQPAAAAPYMSWQHKSWCFLLDVASMLDVLLITLLLSPSIYVRSLIGIPSSLSLMYNLSTISVAILIVISSEPKEDVSAVFYFLECQLIGELFKYIMILVSDLLVANLPT